MKATAHTPGNRPSKSIAAIHVAKKQLGLDDDTYRCMLEQVTGKASLRLMSAGEHGKVLEAMRAKGAPRGRSELSGPYAGKLQALWISGWHLGVVRNRSDEALLAFVKGRTGIDHTRFLRNAADARKAVEALKSMLEREAGVDWSAQDDPARCVLAAQMRLLNIGSDEAVSMIAAAVETDGTLIALMAQLGKCVRARVGA